MQGKHLLFTVHIPGTLAANITFHFKAPFDLQLVGVQAVATNDSDATLALGTTSSAAAYLAAAVIGDSSVPVEKTKANFVGGQPIHIADGTVILGTLDFDGAGGTAAANVTITLIFTEG